MIKRIQFELKLKATDDAMYEYKLNASKQMQSKMGDAT